MLKRKLATDVRQYSQAMMPPFLNTMAMLSIILPPIKYFQDESRQLLYDRVVAAQTKRSLEDAMVINWCRTVKPLTPLYAKGM